MCTDIFCFCLQALWSFYLAPFKQVADFGLSKEEKFGRSNSGLKGTYGYIDPTYISTNKFTAKSDIYSFGIILFELITAIHPHQNLMEYINLVRNSLWTKPVFYLYQMIDVHYEFFSFHQRLPWVQMALMKFLTNDWLGHVTLKKHVTWLALPINACTTHPGNAPQLGRLCRQLLK